MRGQGHQIFVDELARFATGTADARVAAIAEAAAAPLRVAVRGRAGVGRRTVARALRGCDSSGSADVAEVTVYVTTEVLKPEDVEAIAAERRPVLVVLNKADLTGFGGDGPLAAARDRCAQLAGLIGLPVQPMVGLLAVAALDGLPDGVWAGLCALADGTVPADQERLLGTLDMFGTALGVAAVRAGWTPARLRTLLRRVSCVDDVVAGVNAVGAEVRYRRVLDAVAELEALAVGADHLGITAFLAHDDAVLARMAAANDLPDAGSADVRRARAADITRGSLRLAGAGR